jgi:carbon monoxide dehydrogenase subunit G
MDLKGEYRITASRERVWAMLNDAAVLRECIPGCESLEGSAADGFAARVTTKVGPVKATFNGAVTLSNVNPPESYTISGEGKGGVAGFAKGGADVHLAADGADTVLTYTVHAQVGGKLAQLGSRLIDSTAKKLADEFFASFAEKAGAAPEGVIMAGQPAAGVPVAPAPPLQPSVVPPHHGPAAAVHAVEEVAHEVEEEVEAKAAMGFLGGPIVWALLVILALLLVYFIVK